LLDLGKVYAASLKPQRTAPGKPERYPKCDRQKAQWLVEIYQGLQMMITDYHDVPMHELWGKWQRRKSWSRIAKVYKERYGKPVGADTIESRYERALELLAEIAEEDTLLQDMPLAVLRFAEIPLKRILEADRRADFRGVWEEEDGQL